MFARIVWGENFANTDFEMILKKLWGVIGEILKKLLTNLGKLWWYFENYWEILIKSDHFFSKIVKNW